MSFNVGPLSTGLISALLRLSRSRHNLALSFALGISTKLMQYSDVSSVKTIH